MAGSDTLQAGDGDDWLVGGRGGDQLKGGEGQDTYVFMPGDGRDVIADSDGLGALRIDGTLLAGSTEVAYRHDVDTVWASADGDYVYTLSGGDLIDGGTLTISGGTLTAGDEIVIEDFHNGDLGIELNPERRIALMTGVQANPFDGDGYTPETAPVEMRERGARTFTIALSRPARAGEHLRLQLDGGEAGAFVVVTGDEALPFTGGLVELELAAGQDVVTVSIQHQEDADALEALTLSASLVDASGSQPLAERTVKLLGEPEAEAPSQYANTIEGDLRWLDLDPDEPGLQDSRDALGNRNYVQPLQEAPGQEDVLIGGPEPDAIYGRGGRDVLYAWHGFDPETLDVPSPDHLYGGSGGDLLIGFAGDDISEGGSGSDLIIDDYQLAGVWSGGDDRLYGDHAVALPQAIEEGNTDSGSGERGDFIAGLEGADLAVGSRGNDLLSGGSGEDMLVGGAGDDFIYGDRDWIPTVSPPLFQDWGAALNPSDINQWSLAGFDWQTELSVSDDGTTRTFEVSVTHALSADAADPAGDLIHAGAGEDYVVANDGDDLLHGEDGDDVMWGGGGNDTLLGGRGDDLLEGDNGALPSSVHGSDFIDGGAGDDEAHGFARADALFGGTGNDLLDGGGGADSISGEAGDDELYGGNADDLLDGGQGRDDLIAGAGADTLFGGGDDDRLWGDTSAVGANNHGQDLLDGGEGDDQLIGAGGDDIAVGGEGDDRLYGDASWVTAAYHGDDHLQGGEGSDLLEGDGGVDVLEGGAGADVLRGGSGDDSLYGNTGNDILSGGGGVDRLHGGAGSDLYRYSLGNGTVFISDSGSNILRFGSGIGLDDIRLGLGSLKISIDGTDGGVHIEGFDPDNPYRSIGIDRIEFDDGTSLSYEALLGHGFDLEGTGGNDVITGTVLEDRLYGLGGDDTLVAKAGNDMLDGGTGADRMEGNAGDDHYRVDHSGDVVTEVAGAGHDHVESHIDYRLGDDVEDLTLAGTARQGIGNDQGNVITGNAGSNTVVGLGGADSLHGHGGADRLAGGAGGDVLQGGDGADRLEGGTGDDFANGGYGDDTYLVDSSGDRILEQADLIDREPVTGGDGTVRYGTITRSGGQDRVLSSATFALGHFVEELSLTGAEAIDGFGSLATTRITGNAGDNALYAYRLNGRVDNLPGAPSSLSTTLDSGADERLLDRTVRVIYYGDVAAESRIEADLAVGAGVALTGGAGDDRLFGDWDNDTLRGGIGNDLLYGSAGADTMVGGQGDDTYVVDQGYEFSFFASDASLFYRDHSEDTLIETAGGGVDTVMANVDFTLGEHFENLTLLDDTGAFGQDSGVYGEPLPSDHHAAVGVGNAGDNRIVGNRYDNRLDGAAGADRLVGGGGDDTYVVDQAGDEVVETSASWRAGSDTVETALDYTLGANVENLTLTGTAERTGTGNELDNRLRGNAAANQLFGLDGADRLDGAAGADRMVGGAGDDHYVVDAAGDEVIEAAGAGYDRVDSGITRALGDHVEHLRLTGDADIDGDGNALANRIEGNDGANRLGGHAGADRLYGGGGADTLTGGAGDDHLDGEVGEDVMAGGAGDDHYVVDSWKDRVQEAAGGGHDSVSTERYYHALAENVEDLALEGLAFSTGVGNALDNHIAANGGANDIFGGAGDDSLDGAAGDDFLVGEEGDDELYGGDDAIAWEAGYSEWYGDTGLGPCAVLPNHDWLIGGAGQDRLDGGSGDDYLAGGEGDDTLYGGDDGIVGGGCGPYGEEWWPREGEGGYGGGAALGNDDELYGGAGRDSLAGGTGDDRLDGGTDIDQMAGGLGDDTYYVDGYREIIEIPGDGGDGSDGDGAHGDVDCRPGGGKGNEGVGNGEDPPPPGHDHNWNDGSGTSPGNPGSRGGGGPGGPGGRQPGRGHDGGNGNTRSDMDCGADCEGFGDFTGGDTGEDAGGSPPRTRVIWHADRVTEGEDGGYDVVYSKASLTLADHVEELHLTGSEAIDATGNAADNALYGNDGANRLDGGAGTDHLAGGAGDDTYVVADPADTVVEEVGGGVDTVESAIGHALSGTGIENLTLTGQAAISASGDGGDNALTGNAAANVMLGLAGDDVLRGGGGADTLRGGAGGDAYVYTPGNGVDRIEDSAGANVLRFAEPLTPENVIARATTSDGVTTVHVRLVDIHGNELHDQGVDFVLGPDGASPIASIEFADGTTAGLADLLAVEREHEGSRRRDRLTTGGEDDVIGLAGHHDSAWAGGGRDRVHGGAGKDELFGQGGDDRLLGEAGRDHLAGGMGFDALAGGGGDDSLEGGCQNDLLLGGAGDDRLSGGAGNDAIAGGRGDDEIHLKADADVVLFNAGDGHDQVNLGANEALTVSLGGELRLDELAFSRAGDDLLLRVGEGEGGPGGFDGITFENWYDRAPEEVPEVTLQMVMEASEDFDTASDDIRRNRHFTRYDLNALVGEFDEGGRDGWALTESLLDSHMEGSGDSAVGGEPACRYGLGGSLTESSMSAVLGTLSSSRFGEGPQRAAETTTG